MFKDETTVVETRKVFYKKVRKAYIHILLLLTAVIMLAGCEIKIRPGSEDGGAAPEVEVRRYDRLESRYLTTGDFSALQQMNIDYPMETRTLLEDMLQIGEVDDPEINNRFLNFYQDTVLQSLIADAEVQYADMSDINRQFKTAFERLARMVPDLHVPLIYTQIGALGQSIVIGNGSIGISLDKYMGADYPLYRRYYTAQQRSLMTRRYIVPDAMSFYLLSLYPLRNHDTATQKERDMHMGKVMWAVNRVMGRRVFATRQVASIETYMKNNPGTTLGQLFDKR